MGPPDKLFVFSVKYSDGHAKKVEVADWNLGGAWATLGRDLNKQDHCDTNTVESIRLVEQGALEMRHHENA